jgi:hypothetical protein
MQRRRFKQSQSLEQRINQEATDLRQQVKLLPPGRLREQVLRKARQLKIAARFIKADFAPPART